MASTIQIGEGNYRNPLDGIHAQVDLSGTPVGTLSFWLNRVPVFSTAYVSTGYTEVSPVNTPAVTYNIVTPGAELYYIWAVDNNGQAAGDPGCVFVGPSNFVDINLIGYWLRDTIIANKQALNVGMQEFFPGITVKQIVYGSPTQVDDWPCVFIDQPNHAASYVSFPYGRVHEFSVSISCVIMHQDRQTATAAAAQLGETLMYILNSPPYESVELASGTGLYLCQCTKSSTGDQQVSENKWAGGVEIAWSANAHIIDTLQGVPY